MKAIYWLLVIFSLIFMNCAGGIKIADLEAQPGKYNEKEVKVKGEVVQTFAVPILSQSLVKIDDGTGQIWVKPDNKVPFKGDKITVNGTLKVGLTIANQNLGLIIVEKEKK
ncbi:MAG: hypothetical protein H6696_04875 [Deferribacteres bacterium]|nr:hypothetical protein [candidate division KSB1 bacterium]MCB9501249.1 hypothetical protein [Deferribacteres bacterium]